MDLTLSNGNSFGGDSMSTSGKRSLEPWLFRLQRAVQDRGSI